MSHKELDLFQVKAAARRELGHIDGVQGFGVDDNALRVYLRDAAAQERLPADFHGVPIEPVVGTITALAGEG